MRKKLKEEKGNNYMTFDELLKDAENRNISMRDLCKSLYDENVYLNKCVTIEHEAADYWASECDRLIDRIKKLESQSTNQFN